MSAMYGHADDDWLMRAHGDIDQWAAVMDVDADDRPIDWNWVRTLGPGPRRGRGHRTRLRCRRILRTLR